MTPEDVSPIRMVGGLVGAGCIMGAAGTLPNILEKLSKEHGQGFQDTLLAGSAAASSMLLIGLLLFCLALRKPRRKS